MRRIDSWLGSIFGRVLRFLCELTGKSNFFFARVAAHGALAWWTGALIYAHHPVAWLDLLPLQCVQTGLFIVKLLAYIRVSYRIERLMKQAADEGWRVRTPDRVVNGRIIDIGCGSMAIIAPFLAYFLVCGVADYWLWDYRPPRQSRIHKAIRKLRDRLAVAPGRVLSPA